jgi:cyclopropane fatty-acyl-phospholipid synthase-like methyltransferase
LNKVSNPDFWDNLYIENSARWDLGGPTPILKHHLKHNKLIGDVCVLGCGNGHDVIELSNNNLSVYAVDFSIEAINNLKNKIPQESKIKTLHMDIFDLSKKYNDKFDFIFEYTCYCAIDPVRREEYFDLVYNLLKPNGILFGIFLPLDKKEEDGPPFSVSIDEILKYTSNRLKVLKNYYSSKSIEPRKGSEKVLIFQKI